MKVIRTTAEKDRDALLLLSEQLWSSIVHIEFMRKTMPDFVDAQSPSLRTIFEAVQDELYPFPELLQGVDIGAPDDFHFCYIDNNGNHVKDTGYYSECLAEKEWQRLIYANVHFHMNVIFEQTFHTAKRGNK